MKQPSSIPPEYRPWLENLKSRIRAAQIKAALSVNQHLIRLYWELGQMIAERQENAQWGAAALEAVAADLKVEFPNLTGFSRSNLAYMAQFYRFYCNADEFVQQVVGQIPWGHNILIFTKSNSLETAHFYLVATVQNNWSRNVLAIQVESKLHERQGQAITNFAQTLPQPQADLAQQTLKDPYLFDFLAMTPTMHELDMEKQLTDHIVRFLLELGAGFAFIGRQYPLQVGEKTFSLDLLFYHIRLRCFVAIDLKMEEFAPEHAGKMNFYLSAVDDLLRTETDNPSIGIILCKSKNRIEVEYALRDLNKPIGVSQWILTQNLPAEIQSAFPTIEQLEQEFSEPTPPQ
ncbi:MAG: PDDEXK nuclease domain-containing protein [Saprospiraceae bacterium]|nr:PDDEXK nuclease domain-containing protein [Saprospiraceae bacterium]